MLLWLLARWLLARIGGRKPALLGAIVLLGGGSAICGWSDTVAQWVAERAVQGSGAGGIIVLVNISISDMWSARSGLGNLLGPLLGGIFTQHLTWRWVFWINLPCCVAAFLVLYLSLDTNRGRTNGPMEDRRMDWIGTAAIVSMTVLTLLSLDLGGVVFPRNSPKVLSILVSGLVLCAGFITREAKGAADPLIPAKIVDSSAKASPLFVCFTHGIVNVSSWYFLPLYFQAVRGASPVRSDLLLMSTVVVQALVGVVVGGIIYRYGWIRSIIWTGMAFSTLGLISLGATTSLPPLCDGAPGSGVCMHRHSLRPAAKTAERCVT